MTTMTTVFLMLVSGAAGFWAAARNVRRVVDQRFAELQHATPNGAATPAPPPVEKPAAVATPAPAEIVQEPAVTPEVIMVISAAIAAFFGKQAKVKSIRRIGPQGFNPWAQQGRASIQASHNVMWAGRGIK